MVDYNFWFWMLLSAAASALPLVVIKEYIKTNNYKWLIASYIIYAILVYSYIKLLGNTEASSIYPLSKILSIIIVVGVGLIFLSEDMCIEKALGIGFGFVSIYMLNQSK